MHMFAGPITTGDMRIGLIANVAITAGNNNVFTIVPADPTVEWELLTVLLTDTAKIDVADTAQFYYKDEIAGVTHHLQASALVLDPAATGNMAVFPNRATTSSQMSINVQLFGYRLKVNAPSTNFLTFNGRYGASATVGTRQVQGAYVYRLKTVT